MNDGRRSEMKYAESISIPFIDCGQISFIYTWKWFKIKYKTNIKSKLDPLVYFWTRVKSNLVILKLRTLILVELAILYSDFTGYLSLYVSEKVSKLLRVIQLGINNTESFE